jgi:hypothetical protein
MKKLLFVVVASTTLMGLGCKHHSVVGGKCDCQGVPGDSYGPNPHLSYGQPVIVNSTPGPVTTTPVSPAPGTFEPVPAPKTMPIK